MVPGFWERASERVYIKLYYWWSVSLARLFGLDIEAWSFRYLYGVCHSLLRVVMV